MRLFGGTCLSGPVCDIWIVHCISAGTTGVPPSVTDLTADKHRRGRDLPGAVGWTLDLMYGPAFLRRASLL